MLTKRKQNEKMNKTKYTFLQLLPYLCIFKKCIIANIQITI